MSVYAVTLRRALTGAFYQDLNLDICNFHELRGESFALLDKPPHIAPGESFKSVPREYIVKYFNKRKEYLKGVIAEKLIEHGESKQGEEWLSYSIKLDNLHKSPTYPEVVWPIKPAF